MNLVKTVASAASLATGALGAYAGFVSSAPEGNQTLLGSLGVLLILTSLVCFYGANLAFAGSAVLAGIMFLVALISWSGDFSGLEWATLILAIIAVALGMLAFRSTQDISEQANPMNLPVFG